jgi:hypothetical protein
MLTFTTTYGKIEKSIFMSDSFSPAAALVTSLPLFKETMMEIDELMKAIEVAAIDYYDYVTTHDTVNKDDTRLKADALSLVAAKAREALRAEFARLQEAIQLALAVIGNSSVTHITGEHMENVRLLNELLKSIKLEVKK